ncbi:MAG: TerB family tellurite resistance protein [Phaeodactylibacter sp.]|nr:TerB family tellurite resistance protein [Phaeodactylibacter sp.]
MIIFGTRGVKSTVDRGDFYCPQCESDREYKYKKVTRFFTLYFIPIIPLGRIGEYVECQSCRGTFIPRVLEYKRDPGADQFLSEYEKAMKHSMVLMMLADGEIDPNEKDQVLQIINKFGHNDMTMTELEDYIVQVQNNPEDISTYLKKVGPMLNEHGKEVVIRCAFSVAAADGHIDDSEIELIKDMAEVMEMSPSHLKGIMLESMPAQGQAQSFSNN